MSDRATPVVEKVAQAMHNLDREQTGPRSYPWGKLDESTRQWWRDKAKVAIAAYEAHYGIHNTEIPGWDFTKELIGPGSPPGSLKP